MIFKIKRSFVALTLLLSSAHHSDAIIPTTAFKGISGFFEDSHYSPTLGKVALDVGLVSNLRFYGIYTQGIKDDGTRDYLKDTSKDPLWNLVFQLFPSTGGTFTSETTGSSNIGHYLNDTHTVALLLDYAYQVRKNSADEKKTTKTILDTFIKPDKGLKKNVPDILKSIKDAISKEGDFYPTYTTEQIILAFLCHKFNTQDDLKSFIKAVNKINQKIVPDFNSSSLDCLTLFTQNDIEAIKNKEFQGIDDIYNLANADMFTRMTPYKPGAELLSNGNAYPYDRKNNKIIEGKQTFADCTETTLRHLINMLTYDAKAKQFDLSHLKKYVGEHNPYFKNMEDFYKFQTPHSANSGDTRIRSLWNTVVCDLKNDDKLINYKKGTFELRARYINVIQVFKKMFNLQLPEEQKELESLDVAKADLYQQKQWVEAYLSVLFNALNPDRSYDISTSKLYWDAGEQDIFGELEVKVKNDKNPLFSFVMDLSPGHGELSQLKDFQEQAIIKFSKFNEKARESKTTIQSLLLLTPQSQSEVKNTSYRLYPYLMEDNKARINVLSSLDSITKKAIKNNSFSSEMQQRMEQILGNILSEISWDDREVAENVSPVIFQLSNVYAKVLQGHINGLYKDAWIKLGQTLTTITEKPAENDSVRTEINKEIEQIFSNTLSDISRIKLLQSFVTIPNHSIKMEQSDIPWDDGEIIKGISSYLPKVYGDVLQHKVKEFYNEARINVLSSLDRITKKAIENNSFSSEMNKRMGQILGNVLSDISWKDISWDGGDVSRKISEKFIYRSLPQNYPKVLQKHVKGLYLNQLDNKKFWALLPDFSQLEYLGFYEPQNITQFSVKNMKKLETLRVDFSSVEQIEGLSECTSLEKLQLHFNPNLKLGSLEKLKNLKSLSLMDKEFKQIDGLSKLTTLEKLELADVNIKQLSLKGFEILKNLTLNTSSLEEIEGLSECTSLQEIDLSNTPIKQISVKGFKDLRFLWVNEHIHQIDGLSECKNLERLVLNYSPITKVSVKGLKMLRDLYLHHANIEEIEGLEDLTSLKYIGFRNAKNLSKETLEAINKLQEKLPNLEVDK
jgi:hypothetical protein